MKVFLDECVDRRLAPLIAGHDTKTARQMGWAAIQNGELLRLAAQQFDVFLTVDRNLSFQQNVAAHDLAVVVMRSRSNRLADLRLLVPHVLTALEGVQPGTVTIVPP